MKRIITSLSLFLGGLMIGVWTLSVSAQVEYPDQSPDGGTVIPNFTKLLVGSSQDYIEPPTKESAIKIGGRFQGIYLSGLERGLEVQSYREAIDAVTTLPTGAQDAVGIDSLLDIRDRAGSGYAVRGEMKGAFGYGILGRQESVGILGGAGVLGTSKDTGNDDKMALGALAKRYPDGSSFGVFGELRYNNNDNVSGGIAVEKDGQKYGLYTDYDAKVAGSVITDRIWSKDGAALSLMSDGGNVKVNDTLEVIGPAIFRGGVEFANSIVFTQPVTFQNTVTISSGNSLIIGDKTLTEYIQELIDRGGGR